MRVGGRIGVACAAATLTLWGCAATAPPGPPTRRAPAAAPAAGDGPVRLDLALARLGRRSGRAIALDPQLDPGALVPAPRGPWREALDEVARAVDAHVEPCGRVVFVLSSPDGLDPPAWSEPGVFDDLAVEVVFGAIVGHDDRSLGLELDDGLLLTVRLPPPGHAARGRLLEVLATAHAGDRVAARVRWEFEDEAPLLEGFGPAEDRTR